MEKRLKQPAASAPRTAAARVRACVRACYTSVQCACEEIGCYEHFKVLQAVCARVWNYPIIFTLLRTRCVFVHAAPSLRVSPCLSATLSLRRAPELFAAHNFHKWPKRVSTTVSCQLICGDSYTWPRAESRRTDPAPTHSYNNNNTLYEDGKVMYVQRVCVRACVRERERM